MRLDNQTYPVWSVLVSSLIRLTLLAHFFPILAQSSGL